MYIDVFSEIRMNFPFLKLKVWKQELMLVFLSPLPNAKVTFPVQVRHLVEIFRKHQIQFCTGEITVYVGFPSTCFQVLNKCLETYILEIQWKYWSFHFVVWTSRTNMKNWRWRLYPGYKEKAAYGRVLWITQAIIHLFEYTGI